MELLTGESSDEIISHSALLVAGHEYCGDIGGKAHRRFLEREKHTMTVRLARLAAEIVDAVLAVIFADYQVVLS